MKISDTARTSLCAALSFGAALFSSCTGKSAAEKTLSADTGREKAVYELAPLSRTASQPSEGVYYSLFVRSFADSDGDGIGDFNGIVQKLDYLNDGDDSTVTDLGITGIWLLPIFPSPSYHGYDADDYYSVNPDYGTMADFENLLAECQKRGISVIIDMPCNHSSSGNSWFADSREPESPRRNWYRWITPDDGRFNIGTKIWGHNLWNEDAEHKGNYYSGLFGPHMPDYNLDDPELRAEFKNVMKFWLEKGVSGFRYDAAGHVYNSIKLPAGFPATESAVRWWKEIISYNKSVFPRQYSVGEVWDTNSVRAQYIAGLGSCFHFDLGDKYIIGQLEINGAGAAALVSKLAADLSHYARSNPDYIDAPFLTNHDQPRAASLLKGDTAKLKAAAALYLLSEGVPFIYYGEEIGMMSGSKDETKRTPMLWNTSGRRGKPRDRRQTTWADPDDCDYNQNTKSVAEQEKNPDSLLEYYKRLIRLKTAYPALYRGRLRAADCGAEGIAAWEMVCDSDRAFVMHNLSAKTKTVPLPEHCGGLAAAFISSPDGSAENGTAVIPPLGTIVLVGE